MASNPSEGVARARRACRTGTTLSRGPTREPAAASNPSARVHRCLERSRAGTSRVPTRAHWRRPREPTGGSAPPSRVLPEDRGGPLCRALRLRRPAGRPAPPSPASPSGSRSSSWRSAAERPQRSSAAGTRHARHLRHRRREAHADFLDRSLFASPQRGPGDVVQLMSAAPCTLAVRRFLARRPATWIRSLVLMEPARSPSRRRCSPREAAVCTAMPCARLLLCSALLDVNGPSQPQDGSPPPARGGGGTFPDVPSVGGPREPREIPDARGKPEGRGRSYWTSSRSSVEVWVP